MEHGSETPPVVAGTDTSSSVAKGSSSALPEESPRPIFSSGLSFATCSRWHIDADCSLASAPGSDPAATKHTVTALLGLLPRCQGRRAVSRSPAGDLEQHPLPQPQEPRQEDSQMKPARVPPVLCFLRAPWKSQPFTPALPFASCH